MQSKTESNYRIPDIIVIEDDSKIPSRELTNQRRSSRRRKSTRRPTSTKYIRSNRVLELTIQLYEVILTLKRRKAAEAIRLKTEGC
jgi:hypothetical protein